MIDDESGYNAGFNTQMLHPSLVEVASALQRHANDPVNHPAHYTDGGIECIDAIRAALTPEEFRGFCKGNVLKYVWRERLKGGDESLSKAVWYLNKATP